MENKRDSKYDDDHNHDDKTRESKAPKVKKLSLMYGMFLLNVSVCSFYCYYVLLHVVGTSLF